MDNIKFIVMIVSFLLPKFDFHILSTDTSTIYPVTGKSNYAESKGTWDEHSTQSVNADESQEFSKITENTKNKAPPASQAVGTIDTDRSIIQTDITSLDPETTMGQGSFNGPKSTTISSVSYLGDTTRYLQHSSSKDNSRNEGMGATTDSSVRGNDSLIINIGVYSVDEEWANTVRDVWYQTTHAELFNEELIYIGREFENTMQGIIAAADYLRSMEIAVILGAYNMPLQLAAQELRIPYFVTSQPDDLVTSPFTYYLLPQNDVLQLAVLDVIKFFEWSKVGIIYDNHQGLHMMGAVLEHGKNVIMVQSWRVTPEDSDATLKKKLISIREQEVTNSVLICDKKLQNRIFEIALQLSMMSNMYSWIPVVLNPNQEDFLNYTDTMVNLTIVELQTINGVELPNKSTDYISAYDAHSLIVKAGNLYATHQGCGSRFCNITASSLYDELKDIVRSPTEEHLTFTDENRRNFTELAVLSLTPRGFVEIGSWVSTPYNSNTRLTMPRRNNTIAVDRNTENPIGHKVMQVVTILDPPFVMLDEDENKDGNDKFRGFLPDLMKELSERINFRYEMYLVPDGNYGKKISENGSWNGMIRELIEGRADMCLGAISITSEREEVVDFTKPFMQKSYNLLIKKPKEKSSIFQFLWPLSEEVWLLTISSLIVLGCLLCVMDHISPNSSDASERFSLTESVWFIYGSLVGVGTEMIPRTISGRVLSASWWFFSLILISSYTANLAAFLTVTKINTPVNSLQDLVNQNTIKYGTVKNTNAHSFFMNSKLEIFRKMWSHIEISNGLVDNSTEGLDRVQEGNYAFIWDTPVNKYLTQNECDVMTVGEPFDQKGYGIGVPKGVSYGDDLTLGILRINEAGILQQMEDSWWTKGKCGEFTETKTSGTKELAFHSIAGVFLVLAIGSSVAFILCFIECVVNKLRKNYKQKKRVPSISEQERDATELRTSLCNNSHDSPKLIRLNTQRKSWLFQ